MNPQRYQQVYELFKRLRGQDAEAQTSILDQACAEDPQLRREVEALLAADADPLHLESAPGLDLRQALPAADQARLQQLGTPPIPERVGHYAVRRLIASGGMGVVYEAVQERPHRTVALKVLKSGIASQSALRRFEHESQLLARLHHPHIAQVYEAGVHNDGTHQAPYFAMEYIPDSKTLLAYAAEHQLDNRRRLELFAKVCDAVHHGHQRGIIHRDIKPGNILVDRGGQPKIIDFGVARATDSDMAVTTMQTEVGQIIGTLQYMSPEQCAADPHDLDSRSDVYALGVVLYELLCDQPPYDVSGLAIPEAMRRIRADTPTTPSSFNRRLRGDVETIVLKALAKERERRYRSAAELADDIRRYLHDEPIVARPPSAIYQLGKFARRNRTLVGSMAAILLILCAAVVVSTTLAIGQARARADAQAAWSAEQQQRREAEREANIAREVNEFLNQDLLAAVAPSPEEGQGQDVLMRDVLDEAAVRIEAAAAPGGRFAEEPLVEAAIRATLAQTYKSLGEYAAAEPHAQRAYQLRSAELGEEHHDTLLSMNALAHLYALQGRHDEAEQLYVTTLELSKRALGAQDACTLTIMANLARLYGDMDRHDEAETLYMSALQTSTDVLGGQHPKTLTILGGLAILYKNRGQYKQAEPLYRQVLEVRKRVQGPEHPSTLISMNDLALLYFEQGLYDQAEPLYVEALEIGRRVFGEQHPNMLCTLGNLANVYTQQRRFDKAEPLHVEVLEIRKRELGEEHPTTLMSMNNLANVYLELGRHDDAEPLYRQTLELKRRVFGSEHATTLQTMANLALLYTRQGRPDAAEPLNVETLEIRRRVLGDKHPNTIFSMLNLAFFYTTCDRFAEASVLEVEALAAARQVWPDGSWLIGAFLADHGRTLLKLQRYEDAEAALLEGHAILAAARGAQFPKTMEAVASVAELYEAWDRPDQAAEWRAKLPAEAIDEEASAASRR